MTNGIFRSYSRALLLWYPPCLLKHGHFLKYPIGDFFTIICEKRHVARIFHGGGGGEVYLENRDEIIDINNWCWNDWSSKCLRHNAFRRFTRGMLPRKKLEIFNLQIDDNALKLSIQLRTFFGFFYDPIGRTFLALTPRAPPVYGPGSPQVCGLSPAPCSDPSSTISSTPSPQ